MSLSSLICVSSNRRLWQNSYQDYKLKSSIFSHKPPTTHIELLHAHLDDLLGVIILQAQGPGALLVSAMSEDNLIVWQLLGVPLPSTKLINIGSGTKIGKLRELTYWRGGFELKEASHLHA